MGIAGADLVMMMKLHDTGRLNRGARILDLGAQNLFCRGSEHLVSAFINKFSPGLAVDAAKLQALANGAYAGELFTLVGFKYRCLDVFEAPNGIVFDLNFDVVPGDMREAFDLVMNHGTTEHLLNQYNAFKCVHEFTAPGGVMIHSLPFQGYVDHGFFSYSGKFFNRLAEFNGYEMVDLGFSESAPVPIPTYVLHAPSQMRPGGKYNSPKLSDAGIYAVVQKSATANTFVPPLDVDIKNTKPKDVEALLSRVSGFTEEQRAEVAARSAAAYARVMSEVPFWRRVRRFAGRLVRRYAPSLIGAR